MPAKKKAKPKAKPKNPEITNTAIPKKKSESKIGGLIDNMILVPFEVLGKDRPRWNLSATEKNKLKDAVNGVVEKYDLSALNDPGAYLAVVLLLIVLPRAVLEIRDYAKTKKPGGDTGVKPQRSTEPDNTDTGEKRPGEKPPDYDGLPAPGGQR